MLMTMREEEGRLTGAAAPQRVSLEVKSQRQEDKGNTSRSGDSRKQANITAHCWRD